MYLPYIHNILHRSSVTLRWGAPAYDGGSPIMGYIVEYSIEGKDDWSKCNVGISAIHTTEFTVPGLRADFSYVFRVAAINAVGKGAYAAVSLVYPRKNFQNKAKILIQKLLQKVPGAVQPKEILEDPEIDLDANMRKNIELKAGLSLRLFATTRGRPAPEITWTKQGKSLSQRANIDTKDSVTTLIIPETDRDDSGKYTLTLSNAKGSKSVNINVKILGEL